MLSEIIKNPEVKRYINAYQAGQTIFLEGDDSQDLYILVSGEIEILKGKKKIADISEPGTLFGEMSFFLGAKRTASVKAKDDMEAVRIPKEEASDFLKKFPEVSREISRLLAERLDESNRIVFGLKEFVDQVPDAVLITDREGKVLSWNRAAENLYGRRWNQLYEKPVEEIYEEPEEWREVLEQAHAGHSVREAVLQVRHPDRGVLDVSTSTTVLFDGQHNFQGVLTLARDVTRAQTMERRYRRVRSWLIPIIILLVIMTGAVLYGYPYFSKGYKGMDVRKRHVQDIIADGYFVLNSLLTESFAEKDRSRASKVMKEFFQVRNGRAGPVMGVILLDKEKRVFGAYSPYKDVDLSGLVGDSYAGIDLRCDDGSLCKVLQIYRAKNGYSRRKKSTEIAFEIKRNGALLGWLLFQVDLEYLREEYDMTEENLTDLDYGKSEE